MSNDANRRILVVGDVLGKFTKFYQRIKNVNVKAGPFHFVLCVGSFFSIENENSEDPNLVYIAKDFKDDVKMPIYVLGPIVESQKKFYKPLFSENLNGVPSFEEGYDIACNVTYLGKKGVLTTIDELNIAYLSGFESEDSTDFTFNLSEVNDLIETCCSSRIDLLLTTMYPFNVNVNSFSGKSDYLKQINENGSLCISKLAKFVLPRYHLSASEDQFYEREPYRNHLIMQEQPKLVTRFISIAGVDNEKKEKWLYAFNIVPAKLLNRDELNKQPDDATENPYASIDFESMKDMNKNKSNVFGNDSFFFQPSNDNNRRSDQNNKYNNQASNHSNNKRSAATSQSEDNGDKRTKSSEYSCWFCLSSPQIEKHLIVSIGEQAYLAIAKGGLVENHLLIIPIGHHRSLVEIESNTDLNNVLIEIGQFKNAIIDYFDSLEQVPVFFERNFKSGHFQLQCVALPKDRVANAIQVLREESECRSMRLNDVSKNSNLSSIINANSPYFYFEILGKRFFIGIKPSRGFPIQFGREILAHPELLNCKSRIDWLSCVLDEEDAKQLVSKIKDDFKPYDFTLEED